MRGAHTMSLARIGVCGLGTMGSALALNMAENGIDVAVSNRETDWIAPFIVGAGALADRLHPHERLEDFVAALAGADIHFVGMGVSGGEKGARHGPSMMVGGSEESWAQLWRHPARHRRALRGRPLRRPSWPRRGRTFRQDRA